MGDVIGVPTTPESTQYLAEHHAADPDAYRVWQEAWADLQERIAERIERGGEQTLAERVESMLLGAELMDLTGHHDKAMEMLRAAALDARTVGRQEAQR